MIYFDTSALAKLVVKEPESAAHVGRPWVVLSCWVGWGGGKGAEGGDQDGGGGAEGSLSWQ